MFDFFAAPKRPRKKRVKKLLVTCQLKNAEVVPGGDLHGTLVLKLVKRHNSHKHGTSSLSHSIDDESALGNPEESSALGSSLFQHHSHRRGSVSSMDESEDSISEMSSYLGSALMDADGGGVSADDGSRPSGSALMSTLSVGSKYHKTGHSSRKRKKRKRIADDKRGGLIPESRSLSHLRSKSMPMLKSDLSSEASVHTPNSHSGGAEMTSQMTVTDSIMDDPHRHFKSTMSLSDGGISAHHWQHKHRPLQQVVLVDRVCVSVKGICTLHESIDRSGLPAHLRETLGPLEMLKGRQNTLVQGLLMTTDPSLVHSYSARSESAAGSTARKSCPVLDCIKFEFGIQLPPVLPGSFAGHFVDYSYQCVAYVELSKAQYRAQCVVPFRVLPKFDVWSQFTRGIQDRTELTPTGLQEKHSVFRRKAESAETTERVAKMVMDSHRSRTKLTTLLSTDESGGRSTSATSATVAAYHTPSITDEYLLSDEVDSQVKPGYAMDLAAASQCESKNEHSQSSSSTVQSKQLCSSIPMITPVKKVYRMSHDGVCFSIIHVNNLEFGCGESVLGWIDVKCPVLVSVRLEHLELPVSVSESSLISSSSLTSTTEGIGGPLCWTRTAATRMQACLNQSIFPFSLKVPKHAFLSFKTDLVESQWRLSFEFGISHKIIAEYHESDDGGNLKSSGYDPWTRMNQTFECDETLEWKLPIRVVLRDTPFRNVTRSNSVMIRSV